MIHNVKYNNGPAISGTTQVGDIAIATDNPDYSTGGWVGGVDNSDGYVIVSDTTSTGLVDRPTGGGTGSAPANTPTFWKSAALTDQALLNLINKLPGSAGNFPNVTAARNALASSPYAITNDYNGGGGGAGWLFYAAEGELTVGPPTTDGQAIFTDNLPNGDTNVTFNPNKSTGVNYLNFNLQDSDAVDYTTQFTNLQTNGGTVSVTQNGNTATYVLTPGMAFVNVGLGFMAINADAATQTVFASGPFVYGDPITITIS